MTSRFLVADFKIFFVFQHFYYDVSVALFARILLEIDEFLRCVG